MDAADPPGIKVLSLSADGVVLYGSSGPAFEAAFTRPRSKEWDPLLPYTVVIHNQSGTEIEAYSVTWRCTGRDGVISTGVRSVFNFLGGTSLLHAGPRATRIVSQDMRLEGDGARWNRFGDAEVQLLARFEKQALIEIGIDAVLFADGTTIGEDTQGWIPRWRADKDAVADIFARTTQTPDDQVKLLLQPFRRPGIRNGSR